MTVSAKCYYGLRTIYALAEHGTATPMKANDIAEHSTYPSNSSSRSSAS